MKKYSNMIKLVVILLLPISNVLAVGSNQQLLHMEVALTDRSSLQRGATVFVNYCLSCHTAAFMRYNRISKDLGITEKVLKTNLMFGTDKAGDTMQNAMQRKNAEQFFGVMPPDLSVIARSRGADWLYTYFKSFYIDESRPFGVNNLVFKDVGMPNVLWSLQGRQQLRPVKERLSGNHAPQLEDLELIQQGTQSQQEFDQTVHDLVNFLVYLGEPSKLKRTKVGMFVLLYLLAFAVIAYLLKKEYWRDIH